MLLSHTKNTMTHIPLSTHYTRSLILAAGHPNRKTERDYTSDALTTARKHALRISDHQLKHERIIILSDVHKGDRKPGVDDFEHNEPVYCEALRYYLDNNYRLILNGDIEEGWKASYPAIIEAYESTAFALEREFARQDRYVRIYGNHDVEWANPQYVERYLKPALNYPVRVYPAALLGSRIFVVHGHQGDLHSDRRAWLSRRIVRYLWRPFQRTFGLTTNGTAGDTHIYQDRDHYLFEWANLNRLLLIAGHTHRAIFRPFFMNEQFKVIRDQLTNKMFGTTDPDLQSGLLNAINRLNRLLKSLPDEQTTRPNVQTNYLNEGCCVYTDGISGIEIDQGEIRLIQWKNSASDANPRPSTAERKVTQSSDLGAILARL